MIVCLFHMWKEVKNAVSSTLKHTPSVPLSWPGNIGPAWSGRSPRSPDTRAQWDAHTPGERECENGFYFKCICSIFIQICFDKQSIHTYLLFQLGNWLCSQGRKKQQPNITLNKNITATCKLLVPCFMSWNKRSQTFFICTKRLCCSLCCRLCCSSLTSLLVSITLCQDK